MELTITQNGALYGLQHPAIKKYRGARNKRVIANKAIPADKLLPESSRGSQESHLGNMHLIWSLWRSRS